MRWPRRRHSRGEHRHVVEQIVDRWRVDAGWWQRRIWREYFQLTTKSGLLLLIYHDVRSGATYAR